MTMTMSIVVVVPMMVVMVPGMIPVVVIPTPMIAVPVVGTVPIVVIVPGIVISVIVVGIVVVIAVMVRIEAPVPCVAYIDVGVAAAIGVACVIVVVIVHGGAGTGAETLDAGREIGVVVGLGGGVNHAVGVGHRLGRLIHGGGVRNVVLAVGIIGLVVVSATAADARRDGALCPLSARRVVW